ncbi:hypothetical protein, partial [Paenibacillus sp. SI8]|uniref:hypothetical protein n=1 Tax=Paenibacillus sp. SI8 TaxID=3163026 RepID=UPI003466E42B
RSILLLHDAGVCPNNAWTDRHHDRKGNRSARKPFATNKGTMRTGKPAGHEHVSSPKAEEAKPGKLGFVKSRLCPWETANEKVALGCQVTTKDAVAYSSKPAQRSFPSKHNPQGLFPPIFECFASKQY